jgi:ankyrin repeat protein
VTVATDASPLWHAGRQRQLTALCMAALNGHTEAAELLVETKADVNAQDEVSCTLYILSSEVHIISFRLICELALSFHKFQKSHDFELVRSLAIFMKDLYPFFFPKKKGTSLSGKRATSMVALTAPAFWSQLFG